VQRYKKYRKKPSVRTKKCKNPTKYFLGDGVPKYKKTRKSFAIWKLLCIFASLNRVDNGITTKI